ncbi:MAG: transglycosylase domain-containing protein [Actinobacteria bacterium]|nr:transglycosylase domain-containing protein [Actinomycetota bacterium]
MSLFRARSGPIIVALIALSAAACSQLQELPTLRKRDLNVDERQAQTSRIYDGDGRVLTTLHGRENRYSIPLRRIPRHVRRAVIAVEDRRFFGHSGVDWRAVIRAAVENVREGGIEEGGSTITQQYIKNVIIAPGTTADVTLDRKIDEAVLARQLENSLTKADILERYLNTVYFGQGAYGIQAAAKAYFDRGASRLTMSQGATLAAVIRSPDGYDPLRHPRAAKARRNLVLGQLGRLGWAQDAHIARAEGKKLNLDPAPEKLKYEAPYFVDYVKRLITYDPRFKALGDTPSERQEELFQGGLRVYTTIDLATQQAAEAAVDGILTEASDPYASLVAIKPDSGEIAAMVGGRSFFSTQREDRFAKVNLATVLEPNLGAADAGGNAPGAGRQAGSAFKPFALAAALEERVPLSKLYDAGGSCITIPGADDGAPYTPCNYEGSAYGELSLLEATVSSVNTVFARLGQEIGPQAVVDMASRMGIRTPLRPVASAPLGSNEVNALDMASAYATLASSGRRHRPVAITKIVDGTGEVVYREDSRPKQVLDPVTSYLTTSALQQVIERGTGTAAAIGREAAGKTGTAQEYRDAWFSGFTPDLAAAVWVGYPEGQVEMKTSCVGSASVCRPTRITVTGGSWPAMIWQAFMLRALADVPPRAFAVPSSGITTALVDTRNGCLAGSFTPLDERAEAVFATGTAPAQSCLEPGDRIRVPSLRGLSVDAAVARLYSLGLAPSVQAEPSEAGRPGSVIGQSPAPGTPLAKGSLVTVVIARKPEPEPTPTASPTPSPSPSTSPSPSVDTARVPSVIGATRASAQSSLADFEVAAVTQPEPSKELAKKHAGLVWKQAPAAGGEAKVGSTVTIYVNPG